jgi:hypothetical protein
LDDIVPETNGLAKDLVAVALEVAPGLVMMSSIASANVSILPPAARSCSR